MKTFALILTIVSALLCLYCLYTLNFKDGKTAWHILQAVVFAINSTTFFIYWRKASKQAG